MKIAYFFGAGASMDAGMPDTKKMIEFLKDDEFLNQVYKWHQFEDVEQVYTNLEDLDNYLIPLMVSYYNKIDITDLSKEYFSVVFDKIVERRDYYMNKIEKYLIKELSPEDHDVTYYNDYLLKKIQEIDNDHGLTIITTNYDLLLDKAFDDDCIDGFEVEIEGYIRKKWGNKWDDIATSKHTLVKLHGSINWEDNMKDKAKRRGWFKHKDAITTQTPLMIPLTKKDKNYTISPYKELFERFEKIISEVNLLVIIGYTFRDRQILETICKYLDENLHILLISPDAKNIIMKINGFKQSNELKIDDDGEVSYDNSKKSNVYYKDLKFNKDGINEIVKLINVVSSQIASREGDSSNEIG